jgi:hypothetical protein
LRADGFQFQAYIVRVGSWASSGPKVSGPRWSSTGVFKTPPQTRTVSDIRTRKSVGENREPKPKPVDPKPADTRPEPDPLPSLVWSLVSSQLLLGSTVPILLSQSPLEKERSSSPPPNSQTLFHVSKSYVTEDENEGLNDPITHTFFDKNITHTLSPCANLQSIFCSMPAYVLQIFILFGSFIQEVEAC